MKINKITQKKLSKLGIKLLKLKSVKLLGVQIDDKLNFNLHITDQIADPQQSS